MINFQKNDPQDLMSLKELCNKHGLDYSYLYKWAILKRELSVYLRGTWKLSESEVLDFCERMAEKRLKKIRKRQGGE